MGSKLPGLQAHPAAARQRIVEGYLVSIDSVATALRRIAAALSGLTEPEGASLAAERVSLVLDRWQKGLGVSDDDLVSEGRLLLGVMSRHAMGDGPLGLALGESIAGWDNWRASL